MKTVEILEDFSSYPNGKDERAFKAGETPELSNEHADLLVDKGLAKPAGAKPAPAPKPTAAEAEQKDADA